MEGGPVLAPPFGRRAVWAPAVWAPNMGAGHLGAESGRRTFGRRIWVPDIWAPNPGAEAKHAILGGKFFFPLIKIVGLRKFVFSKS